MGQQYDGAVDIVLTAEECRTIVAALEFAAAAPWGPTGAHDGTLECWDRSVAALRALTKVAQAIDDAAYHAELGPECAR